MTTPRTFWLSIQSLWCSSTVYGATSNYCCTSNTVQHSCRRICPHLHFASSLLCPKDLKFPLSFIPFKRSFHSHPTPPPQSTPAFLASYTKFINPSDTQVYVWNMPIFWSMKTSFDFASYGIRRLMGETPLQIGCIRGTGVFKSLSLGSCEEDEEGSNTQWPNDTTSQTTIMPPKTPK